MLRVVIKLQYLICSLDTLFRVLLINYCNFRSIFKLFFYFLINWRAKNVSLNFFANFLRSNMNLIKNSFKVVKFSLAFILT